MSQFWWGVVAGVIGTGAMIVVAGLTADWLQRRAAAREHQGSFDGSW